jgi:hypothetical protein
MNRRTLGVDSGIRGAEALASNGHLVKGICNYPLEGLKHWLPMDIWLREFVIIPQMGYLMLLFNI